MTVSASASDDPRIAFLVRRHDIDHEQASKLLSRLQRSLALDVIDADTGEPIADFDDDLRDLVEHDNDVLKRERTTIPAD